jgi:hypothetical protein
MEDPYMRTLGQFNATWCDLNRTARRQRLVKHLVECEPRPVLEALIQTEAGTPLDTVLEQYARLQPELFEMLGADELPFERVGVIDGGRR